MEQASKHNRDTVFVGLSGGVDSSVSAKRLLDQGYTVVGVFIKTWQPDFITCTWEAERLDAMRVAAHLGIPFLTCDAEESYKHEVALYMIDEYKKGRTPNPDVMCNKSVKFGTFLRFAESHGGAKIATGHYARVALVNGKMRLYRGCDRNKDQSYFLWMLTQHELIKTLFPIGDTEKNTVRDEAEKAHLPTFNKDDSQGVCFLGDIDMKEFLSHYIERVPGNVLDGNGTVIGTHDGALFYTIGERHGFTITTKGIISKPHYVISKNVDANTITVSDTPRLLDKNVIALTNVNQIASEFPKTCEAQFRYRQKPFLVSLEKTPTGLTLSIVTPGIEVPSPGQSCVLYSGDECLGGGIIDQIV